MSKELPPPETKSGSSSFAETLYLMRLQSLSFAIDTLFVLQRRKQHQASSVDLREIVDEVQDCGFVRHMDRIPYDHVTAALTFSEEHGLVSHLGNSYSLTPVGTASLAAYQAYEPAILDPLYESWVKEIEQDYDPEVASKLAIGHILEYPRIAFVLPHIFPNDHLSDWEKTLKLYGDKGYYAFPRVLQLLGAQSNNDTASVLLSLRPDLEDELFPAEPFSRGRDILARSKEDSELLSFLRSRRALLHKNPNDTWELTPLGQAATTGFSNYYTKLKAPLQTLIASR